jgi:hypothetical protein
MGRRPARKTKLLLEREGGEQGSPGSLLVVTSLGVQGRSLLAVEIRKHDLRKAHTSQHPRDGRAMQLEPAMPEKAQRTAEQSLHMCAAVSCAQLQNNPPLDASMKTYWSFIRSRALRRNARALTSNAQRAGHCLFDWEKSWSRRASQGSVLSDFRCATPDLHRNSLTKPF